MGFPSSTFVRRTSLAAEHAADFPDGTTGTRFIHRDDRIVEAEPRQGKRFLLVDCNPVRLIRAEHVSQIEMTMAGFRAERRDLMHIEVEDLVPKKEKIGE